MSIALGDLLCWIKFLLHRCGHKGCWRKGDECFLEQHESPDEYACWDHAHDMGYCFMCGQFWGGVESFDFGGGLCEHCKHEMNADSDESEDCYDDGY